MGRGSKVCLWKKYSSYGPKKKKKKEKKKERVGFCLKEIFCLAHMERTNIL